jgi:cytochrome P450
MATAVLPAVRAPKGSMLLGHLPEYRRDPLDFLTRAARRYGDVVPLRFGPSRLVFFNDPAAIEEILVTKNRSFIKGLTVEGFRATLGNGLFTAEGDAWLRQRRMMQPAFHRQRIAAYGDVMGAYAGRMLDRWGEG